jgi:DNA adenine methylase
MLKINGYSSYFGGKSGPGTYQTIINHIPPHDEFFSLFLGNCGVARHIKPAGLNIYNDIDPVICEAWRKSLLPDNSIVHNFSALSCLQLIAETAGIGLNRRFIFLDPPYLLKSRRSSAKVYRFEMTDSDHKELLEQITLMKDKIMICCYPNDLYDLYLHSWSKHDFYSKTRNGMALERIYYNYELTDELHDYSYIGENKRQRERMKRIKNNVIIKLNRLSFRERQLVLLEIIEKFNIKF